MNDDRPTEPTVTADHPTDVAERPVEPWVPLPQRITAYVHRVGERIAADPGRAAEVIMTVAMVVLGTVVISSTLHTDLLLQNSTPTGGDMGAHVWGPNYLQHHLLPNFRLSGWTSDWYDGFPAYQFYMVVPSLLIVFLHLGLHPVLAIPVLLVALAAAVGVWASPRWFRFRRVVMVAAAVVAVLVVPIPYNQSFKIVTALGLLGIPVACWAFAKLADLPFPIPPITAVAGLIFVYNREPFYNNTGNIIGGNFQSTMAGEFAFSISLTVAILYLGVACRGLKTGRYRALSAGLFALAGLCHLIPAFFVLACTAALFLLHPDKARLKWLASMVPVAGLLTAFWILPFWWRRDYVNDMGWERLPIPNANLSPEAQRLAGDQQSVLYYLFPQGLRWLMIAAAIGVVVSIVRRYRVGLVLAMAWVGVMVAFSFMPQYRLWNARLLPFQYLAVALLAAIAVGELVRVAGIVASGRADRPFRPITVTVGAIVCLAAVVYVVLPLNGVFEHKGTDFGFERADVNHVTRNSDGTVSTTAGTEGRFNLFGRTLFSTADDNPVSGWAAWNYSGLEGKKPSCVDGTCTGGWPEYRDFMATMQRIGQDSRYGCGRAFWEYEDTRINTYGTPMAPMLLPYWTNGCIASQEGLYFESSATVPYHFLMQAELSAKPSRPQRDLRYPSFDLDAGVRHLQLLGVKYYVALSDTAIEAASHHPDLTEIAVTGPWHVYEVADSAEVAPLKFEPVVVTGVGESQADWLPTSSGWLINGDLEVPLAIHGPAEWARVKAKPVPTDLRHLTDWMNDQLGRSGVLDRAPVEPRKALPKITVSDIRHDEESISFSVSEPGVPVLVKASYFPNWKVTGGTGPYRVAPNLMVVIPTSKDVRMEYGRTPPDLLGMAFTVLGLIGLVVLHRRGDVEVSELRAGPLSDRIDALMTIDPAPPSTPAPPPPTGQHRDGDGVEAWRPPPPDPAPRVDAPIGADADDDDLWTRDEPAEPSDPTEPTDPSAPTPGGPST